MNTLETQSHIQMNGCDICGSQGRALYEDLADVTFNSGHSGSLYKCTNARCGAVWANPFPKPETVSQFYSTYYTHTDPIENTSGCCDPSGTSKLQAKETQPNVSRRLKNGLRNLAAWATRTGFRFRPDLRYLGNRIPGKLLDVGCGNGDFLADAAHRGWVVVGQEFDESAAIAARKLSGAEVRVGDLVDVKFDGSTFDAITLGNVLEHLTNPRETLAEAFRLLKPSGLLVSISPNPGSYLHRMYGKHWRGLEVPRHLFLLPPNSSKMLCEQVGFVEIEFFSTPGDFRFMERSSAQIMENEADISRFVKKTPRWKIIYIYLLTLFGCELGEWTVIVARKP